MNNTKTKSVIRFIVMTILLINMGLTLAGKNPIPFDEAAVTEWLTIAAGGLSAIWSWWKNAPMTKKAQAAQDYLEGLKQDGDGSDFNVDGAIEGVEAEETEVE